MFKAVTVCYKSVVLLLLSIHYLIHLILLSLCVGFLVCPVLCVNSCCPC